jgi:hypothetical protein
VPFEDGPALSRAGGRGVLGVSPQAVEIAGGEFGTDDREVVDADPVCGAREGQCVEVMAAALPESGILGDDADRACGPSASASRWRSWPAMIPGRLNRMPKALSSMITSRSRVTPAGRYAWRWDSRFHSGQRRTRGTGPARSHGSRPLSGGAGIQEGFNLDGRLRRLVGQTFVRYRVQ